MDCRVEPDTMEKNGRAWREANLQLELAHVAGVFPGQLDVRPDH